MDLAGTRLLQWRRHWTPRILHMEACHREIRNPRKNPSSFAGTPYLSSLEIQEVCICLNWGRAEPRLKHRYIVPAAGKPSGFGLPLYSFGLPLWLRSTSTWHKYPLAAVLPWPLTMGHKRQDKAAAPWGARLYLCAPLQRSMCQVQSEIQSRCTPCAT